VEKRGKLVIQRRKVTFDELQVGEWYNVKINGRYQFFELEKVNGPEDLQFKYERPSTRGWWHTDRYHVPLAQVSKNVSWSLK